MSDQEMDMINRIEKHHLVSNYKKHNKIEGCSIMNNNYNNGINMKTKCKITSNKKTSTSMGQLQKLKHSKINNSKKLFQESMR